MKYDSLPVWLVIGILGSLAALAGLLAILILGLRLRILKHHLEEDAVFLELTPPPTPHNTLTATQEFFAVLSQVVGGRSWRQRVQGNKASIALEVVSSRPQGIRYLVRLPRRDLAVFRRNLAALAPTVVARKVADYLPPEGEALTGQLLEVRQTGRPDYPLKQVTAAGAPDPIAYVTNALSRLAEDELSVLQLVLTPHSDWAVRRPPSLAEQAAVPADIYQAALHKLRQPLFQVSIRLYIQAAEPHLLERRRGLQAALAAFTYEGYQSLRPHAGLPGWFRRYRAYAFSHRLPALLGRNACQLASSELAALFHFPYGNAALTEDLRLGGSLALPLPLDIKNHSRVALVLGENVYRGRATPIGLTTAERQRHIYIIGGTGNGKSTLLGAAVVQDMRAGKGVALIDPHGDLVESLLNYVPDARVNDVIYFNPADIRYPVGLNLLELPPDLGPQELLQEKDLVTESIVSMFRKIFTTGATAGHRIEYVLRNAVQTALTLPEPTLFTVYDLLNDAQYRKRVVAELDNPDLKLFWHEFSRAGSYQQVSMAAGITAKIGRFLFSASARQILEQPRSAIDFDRLLDEGKILLCNVSKGQLGEDTAELFGIMLLTKLQLASLRRARLAPGRRRPFYLYVDEFQNFATPSFTQLLSEARKYGLFLTMAEQSTSQQSDPRMIDVVLANVGTIVAFRTSSPLDEQLLLPLLSPHVEAGALNRLPAYHFYIRIAAEQAQPPFTGRTVPLAPPKDHMLGRIVIQTSRRQFARQATVQSQPPRRNRKPRKAPPLRGLDQLSEGMS